MRLSVRWLKMFAPFWDGRQVMIITFSCSLWLLLPLSPPRSLPWREKKDWFQGTYRLCVYSEEVRHACTNHYKFSALVSLRSRDNVQATMYWTCSDSCTHVGPPLVFTLLVCVSMSIVLLTTACDSSHGGLYDHLLLEETDVDHSKV